ncbi:MAG: hypothetical protein ACLR5P_01560 [[Eubacterium] siraeum]
MPATSQNKEKFEDYEGFVDKFKPKKTTDDCYTPSVVYDAIAEWVSNEYKIDRQTFCRPFYPGGDYKQFDYSDKVVVDNPPFSILSEIARFYVESNVKFFLFAPTLVACRYGDFCTVLPVGIIVEYENGAKVSTSFITNLEPLEIRARTSPSLYKAVAEANKINTAKSKKQLPKYVYPLELVTTAAIYSYAKYGIEFVVPRSESVRVSALDAQRSSKKAVFGCGWLVSKRVLAEREKAEREKAEREKAERWKLSERELEIIADMSI